MMSYECTNLVYLQQHHVYHKVPVLEIHLQVTFFVCLVEILTQVITDQSAYQVIVRITYVSPVIIPQFPNRGVIHTLTL